MLRRALLIWVVCALPSLLAAETIKVLGGEHEGFTRLVFHVPGDLKWASNQTQDTVLVVFDHSGIDVDLSKAFERISKNRVSNIVTTQRGIEIGLACHCDVAVYKSGANMLVADVSAASAESKEPSSTETDIFESRSVAAFPESQPTTPVLPLAVPDQKSPELQQVSDAEKRLVQQLSRAATLGMVQLAEHPTHAKIGEKPGLSAPSGSIGNISARSTLDPKLGDDFPGDPVGLSGVTCLADDRFDLSSWAAGTGFSSGLAQLRQNLGGEIQAIDDQAALKIARHYLSYGFGVEALAMLNEVPRGKDTDLLRSIALILEDRAVDAPVPLQDYVTCAGPSALWGLLAAMPVDPLDDVSVSRIVERFADLPEALQVQLGPRVSQALLSIGASDEARLILRSVDRQQDTPSPAYTYAKAKTDAREGNGIGFRVAISQTAQADAPISPVALIDLIAVELEAGRPISAETIELLVSYAQQYRGESIETQLTEKLLSARLSASQFTESWELLRKQKNRVTKRAQFDEFFAALVRNASDFDFLKYGAALKEEVQHLSPAVTLRAARRYLDLGFPNMAQEYLAHRASEGTQQERRLLQAEISFQQGNLLSAKAELLGLRGERAERLLAQIRDSELSSNPAPASTSETIGPVTIAVGREALSDSLALRERLDEILKATR